AGAVSEKRAIEGGLGPAGAEVLAEAGSGIRLRRVGLADTFAEGARPGPWLFRKYGLTTQNVVDAAWRALGREGEAPTAEPVASTEGEYAPGRGSRAGGTTPPPTDHDEGGTMTARGTSSPLETIPHEGVDLDL